MTAQRAIPAVFVRGGTSRALVFRQEDLPPCPPRTEGARGPGCAAWDAVFLAALGSPDPNGRQLDGMGGGISSLSKVAVIGPPSRADADLDYTFGQVAVDAPVVGYRGNCGNISAAIGPFAVDEGIVRPDGPEAVVRIHNTNTGKIIESRFPVVDGMAAVEGDFALAGVAGTGAPIRLAFKDPGGAATGRLLPTGAARDVLDVPELGTVEASLVDAGNPVVAVPAAALGLTATEHPDLLSADPRLMRIFEAIRVAAALRMGLVATAEEARTRLRNLPQVALVAPPAEAPTLGGARLAAAEMDLLVRMISAGQPHRATPLTGAMCLAVAARIPGSVVQPMIRAGTDGTGLRIGHPSGILPVDARVRVEGGIVIAEDAVVWRSARRLMEGRVLVPASRLVGQPGAA